MDKSERNPGRRSHFERDPEVVEKTTRALEFAENFCPTLWKLSDPLTYPSLRVKRRTLGARVVEDLIAGDIKHIFLQGPPSAGKSRLIKELKLLYTYLGYSVRTSLYDEALQRTYQIFGDDDEHWSQNPWLMTSANVLAQALEELPPNSREESIAFFEALIAHIMMTDPEARISPQILWSFVAEERAASRIASYDRLRVLIEATAVAVVEGRDRGQLSSRAFAEGERRRQVKGLPPETMMITVLSDSETKEYTKKSRGLAHAVHQKVVAGATINELMDEFAALRELGLLFVGMEDLMAWVNEQIIAASPEFIDKYDDEMYREALEWLNANDPLNPSFSLTPLRRLQVNEIVLPKNTDSLSVDGRPLTPDEKWRMKLIAACLLDKRLAAGLTPRQSVLAWNEFEAPTIHQKRILVFCKYNVGRSVMFKGFFTQLTGGMNVLSAGISPTIEETKLKYHGRTSDNIIKIMAEEGVDVSDEVIKGITPEALARLASDLAGIVVLCEESAVPSYVFESGLPIFIRTIDDPDTMDLDGVRRVREEVKIVAEEIFHIFDANEKRRSKKR